VRGVPNAIVLDGEARVIEGISVYGLGHPAFTEDKEAPVDDVRFEALARAASAQIEGDLEGQTRAWDVIAVHDDRMVEALAGRFPLAISGHFHRTRVRTERGSLFLRIGSTGGAGHNVFSVEGGFPLAARVLYFSPLPPNRLVAYDVIEQSPEKGSLFVERHRVEEEFGRLDPQPAPSP
jgi:hypothetical protein